LNRQDAKAAKENQINKIHKNTKFKNSNVAYITFILYV